MTEQERDRIRARLGQQVREALEGRIDALPPPDPGRFHRDAWQALGSVGLPGLTAPKKYGGIEAGALEASIVLEAAGYECPDNGLLAALNAHLWGCVLPIARLGSEDQKERWLPRLCDGRWLGAHAATEPEAGSDIFSLSTRALRTPGGYLLQGRKRYILSAPDADMFLVLAALEEASPREGLTSFVVSRSAKGLRLGDRVNKAGLRSASMGELILEDVFVSDADRLGAEGAGASTFNLAMRFERALMLATHVGAMQRVLEKCIEYARSRVQFGQRIGNFQSISNRIADMKVRLDCSRQLLYQGAEALDRNDRLSPAPSVSKLFISEAAVTSYLDAIRIHGALGYTTEVEYFEDLRDAIGALIYAGTSDIQRQLIARSLGL